MLEVWEYPALKGRACEVTGSFKVAAPEGLLSC